MLTIFTSKRLRMFQKEGTNIVTTAVFQDEIILKHPSFKQKISIPFV